MLMGWRRLALLTLPAVLAVLAACAQPAPRPPRTPSSGPLTILYTNDTHGRYDPREASSGSGLFGGFAALDARVRAFRAEGKPLLLLDAGDLMTGHPICDVVYNGTPGGALIAMMNVVGYDAWCPGNHEFDRGKENFGTLIAAARFPTVSANLVLPKDAGADHVTPWVIVDRGDLRIGIVGVMTEKLPRLINPSTVEGVKVTPMIPAIRDAVTALDPETDLIVLLSHQGSEEDLALAARLEGVDVIVGGHSHTPLDPPAVVNGIIVVQAGSQLRHLGRLDLVIEDDVVVEHRGRLVTLPADGDPASPPLRAIIDEATGDLDKTLQRRIGRLAKSMRRNYYGESVLGDFVADTLRDYAKADVGLINSGGLRNDLGAGPITIGDIHEAVGLPNAVVVATLSGAQLVEAARHNAHSAATKDHGVLQVSGLAYRWRRGPTGEVELTEVTVDGKLVQRDRGYRVAASDFILVSQPRKYLGLDPGPVEDLGAYVSDVVIARFRDAKGTIQPPATGRIIEEN